MKHYGDENHFSLAATYGNIGNVYEDQGKLEEALHHYNKSLQIKIKHYGDENHFSLADTYHNIGNVYKTQGNLE